MRIRPKKVVKGIASISRLLFKLLFSVVSTFSRPLARRLTNISHLALAAAILTPLLSTVILEIHSSRLYRVLDNEKVLLSQTSVKKDLIKDTEDSFLYNRKEELNVPGGDDPKLRQLLLSANKEDSTGKQPYQAELPKNPKDGITFGDAEGNRQFTITPDYGLSTGRMDEDSRIIYPKSTTERHIYTFKRNGIKNDITLLQAPAADSDTDGTIKTYTYTLDLGNDLEARQLPSGDIGIYSANPTLFGDIQVGDDKSQDLINKARANSQKDTLVFEIPRPFIIDSSKKKNYDDVSFILVANQQNSTKPTLQLQVRNLKNLPYPVSVDPTITVTSTSDFQSNIGNNDNIDFSTSGQITRGSIGGGAVSIESPYATGGEVTSYIGDGTNGTNGAKYWVHRFTSIGSSTFTTNQSLSVEYLIVGGGGGGGAANTTIPGGGGGAGGLLTNVGEALRNISGSYTITVGSEGAGGAVNSVGGSGTNSSFDGLTAFGGGGGGSAGNGLTGGSGGGAAGYGTTTSGTRTGGTGTAGQGSAGGNSTTISSAGSAAGGGGGNSAVGSNGSTTVAGNGGGSVNSSITGTSTAYAGGGGGGKRNTGDTGGSSGGAGAGAGNFGSGSSASIANRGAGGGGGGNSGVGGDGSEGVVVIRYADPSPSTFNTAREQHASVVYNGYLYIVGGFVAGSGRRDIQYCPINSNGSVGTCTLQNDAFTTARWGHTSVVYNGYLYIIGGGDGTTAYRDIQYCPINSNGSVGTCVLQSNAFTTIRSLHASVVYNGYLYIIGGLFVSTGYNDIQYCPINSNGSVGTCVLQSNAFTTARWGHTSVVYNGYLYIIGGVDSTTAYNDIQYCPINSNGSVGTCVLQSNAFTTARASHTSVVHNGYLYIIGGWNGIARYNDIQYCPINSNGSVGTCVQQSNAFTTARAGHTSVVYNGYFYIIGGNSGSLQNDIQSIKIQNSFVPGQTISNITGFSNNRDNHSTLAYNGYLYIAGGTNGTTQYNDIQYCPINADGSVGTCVQQSNAFTIPRNAHQSVIYNGFIFIIAGDIGDGTNLSDIQRCTINVDGSIASPCEYAGDISERRRQFSAVFYNNYIYVIGGYTGTDTSTIERCPVSASGVVSACTVQSGLFVARHAHSSVIYNGYLYIIGGVISNSGAPSTWNYLSQILVCEINQSTGAVGLCSPTSNLSTGKRSTSVVVTNNYLYVVGGGLSSLATTQYDDIEYCPINSNGTVGTCVRKTGALNGARQKHSSVLYDGVLYITGGQSGSVTKLSDIQYLRIGPPDGRTTASWTATTAFATARFGHTTVVYNGFIYVIGGLNSSGSYLNDVQYASINTDGTIGAWAPDVGTSFTNGRRGHTSVMYRGYLYVIGGWNGSTYYNDVQKAPINAGGDIGTWATTTSFSTSRYQHTTVVNNGYLYVIGGRPSTSSTACNPTAAQQCNDVQFSLINESDGTVGAWNYTFNSASSGTYPNGFTDGRWGHASVVYNNYIYILGGYNGTYYNTVQYAAVNSDGTVGTWQSTTSFPTATEQHTAVVANGYIYLIGGYNALDTVHYVSISNNGELNSWSATNSFTTGRHGHASAISNGFVYITGGCSLSTCTTYQSDVQYAPLGGGDYTSRYERTIDTLSAANTVTSFTIDGSALCNYRVSYKLAGSDNIYGSETIVSDVRAGISQTITGGANKRYVAFVVTLDDSLCGGTSTITALSLAYNAVPSSPTLSRPTNGASSIGTLPEFRLDSSDDIDTYLKYKIEVCSTSNCSSVVRTIDQTVSQVGWASRIEFRAGTTSATQYATHNYQTPALSPNTQYWWRAYAIDPNGTNVWSSASSISSFTTITEPVNSTSTVIIRGGVDMGGNVIVQP